MVEQIFTTGAKTAACFMAQPAPIAATTFARSTGVIPTATAAAPRRTCGNSNAALRMPCRKGIFKSMTALPATTKFSPRLALFATGATARTCGSRLCGIGCPAAKENARDMFNMPGMLISHGYLPPVKPDKYVHTTITLEFCLGTMAEIIRPAWDEWDYGGDIKVLREECYPLMREMALFYAAYAKKGDDGYYHVIPCMQEEGWGFYPKFARNKDVISSLVHVPLGTDAGGRCGELLGVDADLRGIGAKWRHKSCLIRLGRGRKGVLCRDSGLGYRALQPAIILDEPPTYPALLADEINLDSPRNKRT